MFSFFGAGQSMWLDEANSVRVASHGPAGIINELRHDNNAPLYYLLLAIWTRALGTGEAAVRSLSAGFYILSAIAVYLVARSIYDAGTAGLCSLLYLVSRQAIKHAQNARMYSLLVSCPRNTLTKSFKLMKD
ncbi:MAG: glycosyltransferase family 39 protein [Candidatus Eisenbacteria bacterium]